MSLNFPSTGLTPNVTTYTLGNRTWLWTGSAWKIQNSNISGYTGSKGSLNITTDTTPPTSPTVGDIWIDSNTGVQYFWLQDEDSSQWVEDSNVGVRGPTGYTGSQGESGLGNTKKFSWSGPADGSPSSGGTTTGTLAGSDAIFIPGFFPLVKLTTGFTNSDGRIVWNLSTIDFTKDLSLNVSFYQDGVNGISFGLAGTSNFPNVQPYSVANNSLSFWYKTNTNTSQFYLNGTAVGSEVFQLDGYITKFADNWNTSKLILQTIGSKRYAFLYHNGILINSLDITTWTPTGTYIFVGASSSSGGNHYVNAVSIDYI
jgi:hypothetical protein